MKKTKQSSLATDAMKLTISKFITLAITFISAMLLSRYLTLEEYGTFSQIMLLINLSLPLFMLGLPNSINYFINLSETKEEKVYFLSNYYSFSLLLSFIIGSSLSLTLPLLVIFFDNKSLDEYFFFFLLFPLAKILTSSLENVLINYNKYFIIFMYRVSNSIFLLLIIPILMYSNGRLFFYMSMLLITELIFTIVFIAILFKVAGKLKFKLDLNHIKRILKFSIPLGLASIVGTANIQLDKLMIGALTDTQTLAIYTNASREIPIIIIATSISAVLIPKVVRLIKKKNFSKVVSVWNDASLLSFYIISIFVTLLFVFAEDVIVLLYSTKYIGGIEIFQVYTVLLLLKFTYFGMILNSLGKTKYILYSSLASLLLNLLLNYPFYIIFGLIGPAIATLTSMLIIILFQLKISAKLIGTTLKNIMPWYMMLKIITLNIILGFLFYYLKLLLMLENFMGEIFESVLVGIIWVSVYMLVNFKKIKLLWNHLKEVN